MLVEIELDKIRKLKFTTLATTRAERELKKPVQKILDKETLGIYELSVLLWAGLHGEDRVSLDKAIELMDFKSWDYTAEKVGEAIDLAFQKGSEAGENLEN